MRRSYGKALLLGLAGMRSFAVAAAGQTATREVPSGRIQVAATSVAVGVGVTWGNGALPGRAARGRLDPPPGPHHGGAAGRPLPPRRQGVSPRPEGQSLSTL
jgi:hypothetical protein